MKLALPNIRFAERHETYAPRRPHLDGARIAFIDGWGKDMPDGSKGMYETYVALAAAFELQYGATVTGWHLKQNVSDRVSDAELRALCANADIVINGQGL